jgi:hypothetical protein
MPILLSEQPTAGSISEARGKMRATQKQKEDEDATHAKWHREDRPYPVGEARSGECQQKVPLRSEEQPPRPTTQHRWEMPHGSTKALASRGLPAPL